MIAAFTHIFHLPSLKGEIISMKRIITNRLACWTTLGFLAVALATVGQSAGGADADQPAKKITKKDRRQRHLPPYYAKIITEDQKEKIFAIEAEYGPKIQVLQDQLDALKAERQKKIEALLTQEQKEKITKAEAEAKEKKKKKADKSESAKPGEKDKPVEKDKTPPAESKPAS